MARIAREYSETGIYHVFFRGINRQHIFEESADYTKFLDVLETLHNELNIKIYAYCLMSNHVHLIIKEQNIGDISRFMSRLLTKYVMWFNYKYKRSGSLIANRYKSKPVDVDEYFLPLIRYVHQNPVTAGLVERIEDYKWSSYNDYIAKNSGLVDINTVPEMLDEDFKEYHHSYDGEVFVVSEGVNSDDSDVARMIAKKYKIQVGELPSIDKKQRNEILQELTKHFSIRQLERVTGVSRGIIERNRKRSSV